MQARVAAICIATVFVGACGSSAADVLRETATRLPDIRSGEMQLEASVTSVGGARTGFTLDGVFSLPTESGALPEADLSYTQEAGGDVVEGRFVSDGELVFVEVGGERIEVPPDQVDSLRASGTTDAESVFAGLAVNEWVRDAEMATEGEVDRITGSLQVARAINDLIEVAERFGAPGAVGLEPLDEVSSEQVSDAVAASSIDIATGTDDRLLRELHVLVEFATPDPELAEALGPFSGATFQLDLEITNPNEQVEVG